MHKNLCVIPARGGSKRIPRKNIREFHGKPIIAYSIETAIKSGIFDQIMVSTEDLEIAEIARSFGASVPFLRSELSANDYATTMDVINEVLLEYSNLNYVFDYVCCIYPTAPLMRPEHIVTGFNKIISQKFVCVFPSVEFSYPIWRSFAVEEGDIIKPFWPENIMERSQDLKKAFHDAGQWYWFDVDLMANWHWPDNSGTLTLTDMEVQDIDNLSDWQVAEIKFKSQNSGKI